MHLPYSHATPHDCTHAVPKSPVPPVHPSIAPDAMPQLEAEIRELRLSRGIDKIHIIEEKVSLVGKAWERRQCTNGA